MPPKKQLPLPIDRPLSRAYLRQFSGWSTEYPPGLSDPTSLRRMENVWVGRDGGVRTRPGLRYLTYSQVPTDEDPGLGIENRIVGTHETFFLNDGSQAYLFAVSENDGTVGFRVLARDGTSVVQHLTDPGIDFLVPQGESVLNFSADTTYVKYLQIDNKIFALSNAGASMRLFNVGETKSAHKLNAIQRPEWTTADKLSVVHPEAAWIDGGLPSSTRKNLVLNPSLITNAANFYKQSAAAAFTRSSTFAQSGSWSMRVESMPARTNLMPSPLVTPGVNGYTGWAIGNTGIDTLAPASGGAVLRATSNSGTSGRTGTVKSPRVNVTAGEHYKFSFNLGAIGSNSELAIRWRWFNESGVQIGSDTEVGYSGALRQVTPSVTAPTGAVQVQIILAFTVNKTAASSYDFSLVMVSQADEATDHFAGHSGTNYFWTGTAYQSTSVYHPPVDVVISTFPIGVSPGKDYNWSAYFRAGSTARACTMGVEWLQPSQSVISSSYDGTSTNDDSSSWTRSDYTTTSPAGTSHVRARFKIAAVPRGEVHYVDSFLLEQASSVGAYFDGSTTDTSTIINDWIPNTGASGFPGAGISEGQSLQTILPGAAAVPTAETATADTLISSGDNDYNFGFFYSFSNQVGESAPSQVTVVKAQRAWSAWLWKKPNVSGEPLGADTNDPALCADQLVATMPEAVFDEALLQGATEWSLYMVTWSDQATVPSTAVRVGTRQLSSSSLYDNDGWIRVTPQQVGAGALTVTLPDMNTRVNYSDPSRAGQGLVAADRMVLVLDPTQQARIKWSSNQQGYYTDFTANKGGGYKTLTTGNLYVPAAVKLWQNPQSVDTLTILCMGTDGRSTSYYMAPAQITSQSEAVTVMGFEETTATPGTTSPYGCEVFNNALYHPLDDQLMKSTANNYNISHKSMTDQIRRQWSKLVNKQRIVSSQHDSRLYYIVHNPEGEALEQGCRGNEVWVFDAQAKEGTWSRWLIQASSLRTIERDGRIYMAVSRPDGLFYLDPDYAVDDVVEADLTVSTRTIRWYLETNTQGANRAHDAWAWLYQVNVTLGNFVGTMSYGIRSQDRHGKLIDISKQITPPDTAGQLLPFDVNDKLKIGRDVMEWYFYASSVDDADGNPLPSAGQLNLVQYRYTPVSVNVGYDEGSVETFEYGRSLNPSAEQTTLAGVPLPMADTRRP